MGLLIKKIRVSGFRAFDKGIEVSFDRGINIILGPVGSGKTSLIKAIEYALYGTVIEVKRKLFKRSDLVNDFSTEAQVVLELSRDGEPVSIRRTLDKKGRENLVVTIGDREYSGAAAQKAINGIVGLAHDDFAHHIMLNYRVLQEVIYGSPSARAIAIDRMFGIDLLEEVFRSVPLQDVKRRLRELELERDRVLKTIDSLGSLESLREELRSLETTRKAVESELEELRKEREALRKKLDELRSVADKYYEIKSKMERISGVIDYYRRRYGRELESARMTFASYVRKITDLLVEALELEYEVKKAQELKELVGQKSGEELLLILQAHLELAEEGRERLLRELHEIESEASFKRREIEGLRREYGRILAYVEELKEVKNRLKQLESKYGRIEEVEEKIDKLKSKLTTILESRKVLKCRLLILKEMLKTRSNECAVCGQPVARQAIEERFKTALAQLKEEGESPSDIERQLDVLEKALEEMRALWERSVELEEYRVEAENLEAKLRDEEEEYRELERSAQEYRVKIKELAALLRNARVTLRLAHRYNQIVKASEEVAKSERELEKLKLELSKIGFNELEYEQLLEKEKELTVSITQLEGKLGRLAEQINELTEQINEYRALEKELEELENKIRAMRALYNNLLLAKNAFREIQAELRERKLALMKKKASEAFKRMYIYSDYDDLDIRVVRIERGEGGYQRSIYDIYARRTRDGAWVPVLPRLSDGQKALIALILAVALYGLAEGTLGFILLDEPVPIVDENLKKALLRGIKELGIGQIILATQSESIAGEPGVRVINLKSVA